MIPLVWSCNDPKHKMPGITLQVFVIAYNFWMIHRSIKRNVSKDAILYKFHVCDQRPSKGERAGGYSWALWPIKFRLSGSSADLGRFWWMLCISRTNWRRTAIVGSSGNWRKCQSCSFLFITEVIRRLGRSGPVSSSRDDDNLLFRDWGSAVGTLDCIVQSVHSISQSRRLSTRSYRSSGWSATKSPFLEYTQVR